MIMLGDVIYTGRNFPIRLARVLLFVLLVFFFSSHMAAEGPAKTIAFTNGSWFNGKIFERKAAYAIDGVLSFRRPAKVDVTIDLAGGFVVPPFAEAHNHNVEPLNKLDVLVALYLKHGIFYVKNPNNLARDRQAVLHKINHPESIDVSFSNGGLTGQDGHPAEIPQRLIKRGLWTDTDSDGGFYYTMDSEADLNQKWPGLLATKPDFIKTYLLYSQQYEKRKNDAHFDFWKGLNPTLLPLIVKKAHQAGLRVSTHIEDAADFHNALIAGVDEVNHMPGFRFAADVEPHPVSDFEISEADAKQAARHGTYVVTTVAGATEQKDAKLRQQQDALNARNLALLLKHRVKLALGSDAYRADTLREALYIRSLHVMDDRTLLNIWCTATAEAIFPHRKIGHLKEGYEASFLALARNPLDDFSAIEQITLEVKQGHVFEKSHHEF